MDISHIFLLFGGLALFLYGMKMMSDGLENAAGNRLKDILERLTSNRFLGVAVGAVITAIIQSSSATTVMVVGFVNSGLMQLRQAVWIIMGANIGTTITGQLIALDIGQVAPLIAFAGVVLVMFFKGKKLNCAGTIIAGLGILFVGMELMGNAMEPLRENEAFISMMTNFQNPFLGILVGAVFTAIIQSSSASVGILQTLAISGLIPLGSAVFVLFGQNIGTCITAVIASIGTNRNAKRTTIIHLLFNIIGTIIFVIITLTTPFVSWMEQLAPSSPAAQIANIHTIFNIVTTLLLLPFGSLLAKLACKILPEKPEEGAEGMHLAFVKEHNIGSTAIAISQLKQEIGRMFSLARENVQLAFQEVNGHTNESFEKISQNEEYIDYLNMEITRYVARVSPNDMPEHDSQTLSALFKVTGNIERISDHAMNLAEYVKLLMSKGAYFSKQALEEAKAMQNLILQSFDAISSLEEADGKKRLDMMEKYEQQIDDLNEKFRENQIHRMKKGACDAESSVIYSEMLTDMERMSDHLLNIAEEISGKEYQITQQNGIAVPVNG